MSARPGQLLRDELALASGFARAIFSDQPVKLRNVEVRDFRRNPRVDVFDLDSNDTFSGQRDVGVPLELFDGVDQVAAPIPFLEPEAPDRGLPHAAALQDPEQHVPVGR